MSDPCLQVEGLVKSFFGVPVLHDVSFEVHAGEILGLVGENGSGKSTAMNIVAGVLPSDAGRMCLDGAAHAPKSRHEADAAGVAFIQQELGIVANLTAAENIFLGRFPRVSQAWPILSRKKMRLLTNEILASLDLRIDPNVLAGTLSPGERQLLEIGRGLATKARVMIFDEPTTSLTEREMERLFEIMKRLKARGVAIIFISHVLKDVLRLADRIVVMRDGQVARGFENARITPEDLILAMVGRSIDKLFPERPLNPQRSTPLLEVEKVCEPGVIEDITFDIHSGEIVGLAGLMGSGRSELARVLFGLDPHRTGSIRVGSQRLHAEDLKARMEAGVAFLTEDRRHDGLMMEASVAENMALAALPQFSRGAERRIDQRGLLEAMQALGGRLHLKTGPLESTPVRSLSGGNQQKVVLGRWLLRDPRLLILDEPTRGVDIGAKEEIYRVLVQLAQGGMAILLISSELEELIGLSDRILVLARGRLLGEFDRADFNRERILRVAFGEARVA